MGNHIAFKNKPLLILYPQALFLKETLIKNSIKKKLLVNSTLIIEEKTT